MLLIDSGSADVGSGNTYRFNIFHNNTPNVTGVFLEAQISRCEYDYLIISDLVMPDLPLAAVSVHISGFPVFRNQYTRFTYLGTKIRSENGLMTIRFDDRKLKFPFHIKNLHEITVSILDPICPIELLPVRILSTAVVGNNITVPAHGLTTGDQVEYSIDGCRKKDVVTVIDADNFTIPDTIVDNYLELIVSSRRFVFTLRFE